MNDSQHLVKYDLVFKAKVIFMLILRENKSIGMKDVLVKDKSILYNKSTQLMKLRYIDQSSCYSDKKSDHPHEAQNVGEGNLNVKN